MHPIVLGGAWLQQEKATIDYGRECIYLGGSRRPPYRALGAMPPSRRCGCPAGPLSDGRTGAAPGPFPRDPPEFTDVFADYRCPLPNRSVHHEIRLTDSGPFCVPSYRYSPEKRRLIDEQVKEVLATGAIEATTSPYASPVLIVARPTAILRRLPPPACRHRRRTRQSAPDRRHSSRPRECGRIFNAGPAKRLLVPSLLGRATNSGSCLSGSRTLP